MGKRNIVKYIVSDFIAALVSWVLFYIFRRINNDFLFIHISHREIIPYSFDLFLIFVFYPFVCLLVHYLSGFYNVSRRTLPTSIFLITFFDAFVCTFIAFFAAVINDRVTTYAFYYKAFASLWFFQFVVTYIGRILSYEIDKNRIRKGKILNNVIIVGTCNEAVEIGKTRFKVDKSSINQLLGYVKVLDECDNRDIDILGTLKDLSSIIEQKHVHSVVLASKAMDENLLFHVIGQLMSFDVHIYVLPTQNDIVLGKIKLKDIYSEPLICVSCNPLSASQQAFKRTFDVVISAVILIILMPLMLVVGMWIKLSSKGPVFFKQERVGHDGKPFIIYKFRSMYLGSEAFGPRLSSSNDSRITGIGKFLRRYHLDELPQLWNIIKGDMSIVGPRPEREYYIKRIEKRVPYYCLIYKIKPGLLSWGPIKIGYTDTLDKMVDRLNYDLIYIDSMSLLTDFKIIFFSIETILKGNGV